MEYDDSADYITYLGTLKTLCENLDIFYVNMFYAGYIS